MTSMIKSAAFQAGVRDGLLASAMSKEAIGFSGIASGVRGLATRAAPFVAQHVNPMVSAAQAGGQLGGAGGAVAGAAGSAVNSIGRMMSARGGARVVNLAKDGAGATRMRNPLLNRLGGAVSVGGELAGAMA